LLTQKAKQGIFLAAICAAPSVLGGLGLLKGKKAVCYPGFESELTGAILSDQKVVRDGKILTAAGMGVAFPFGLAAVEMLSDSQTADRVRRSVIG
jgi:4-methyl-5(b-hydroxyethyl)-thiazole monophosphate biosynthesis